MNPAVMSAVKRTQRGPVLMKIAAGTDPRAQGFVFTGDANRWQMDAGGTLRPVAAGTPRYKSWLRTSRGLWVQTLLMESLRTNVLLNSANFAAAGTNWIGGNDFTIATVPSIFEGRVAYKYTNLATNTGRAISQAIGVFTGAPETHSIIVENVNAANTRFGLQDTTTGTFVIVVQFDWATHTPVIAGGAGSVRVLDEENGRYRLAITATGTAGHGRRPVIYPTGDALNTDTAILHHAQHEEAVYASSPIITDAAQVTRAAEWMTAPWPYAAQPMSVYESFVERGTLLGPGSNALYWALGHTGLPLAMIRYNRVSRIGTAVYQTGGTPQCNVNVVVPALDDEVETRTVLRTNNLSISLTNNGGAETDPSGVTAPLLFNPFPRPWSPPGRITINSNDGGGGPGSVGYRTLVFATADRDMDYLRSL